MGDSNLLTPNDLAAKLLTSGAIPEGAVVTPYFDYLAMDPRYLERAGAPQGFTAAVRDNNGGLTQHNDGVAGDTLFFIGSVTKMFTAATILRMTEESEYTPYLPQGVDTTVADLLPILRERFPDVKYLSTDGGLERKIDDHQQKLGTPMTLKSLLQHTAGIEQLDDVNPNTAYAQFRANQDAPIAFGSTLDWEQTSKNPEPGNFSYSNPGYQILGAVIASIDYQLHPEIKRDGYAHTLQKLLLDKVGLEHTFTTDQIEASGSGTDRILSVKGHPEISIAQAQDYAGGKEQRGQLYRYFALGDGGLCSSPDDMTQFAQAFFSNERGKSLFDKPETHIVRDDRVQKNPDKPFFYAMGHSVETDNEGKIISRGHPGGEFGYHSALTQSGDGKTSAVCVVYETITPAIANINMKKELGEKAPAVGTPEWQQEILKRAAELKKDNFVDELIAMRQEISSETSRRPNSWQELVGKNGLEGKTYPEVIGEGIGEKGRE